jgi:RimJ/RimL family protein N-acetyltransferase
VPVGSPVRALLRPVPCRHGETRRDDVVRLTEWRNRFATAFLTEFRADVHRTERWLVETVHPDDTRILFMVDDLNGVPVGCMGLASIDWQSGLFEADNVARGAPAPRGLMGETLQAMLRWAVSQLGLVDPWLRVRSDNTAVEFYERIGFVETRRIPLRRHAEPGTIRWVEDPTAPADGLAVVYMRWEDPAG